MKIPSIVAALTLMVYSLAYAQTSFWQAVGLDSLKVNALVVTTNDQIFAGTGVWDSVSGGVFRSTDNGNSWTETGLMNTSVLSLAVNPNGHIFAGLGGDFGGWGISRSADNGNTWTQVLSMGFVNTLAINPQGHIFASIGGVLRSTDNGTTWDTIYSVVTPSTGVSALAINADGHIFVGTQSGLSGGTIDRSTDNGENWTNCFSGGYVYDLAISPLGHIFAGTSRGIFRSTNNGDGWTQMLADGSGIEFPRLAINSSGDIFASRVAYGINTVSFTALRSTNEGVDWSDVGSGLPHSVVYSLVTSPSGYVFAGTYSGVFRSINPTTSPKKVHVSPDIHVHPNPTTHQFETSIAVHPSNPRIALIGANAGHSSGAVSSIGWYYTTDGGSTWSGRDTLPTHTTFSTKIGDPAVCVDLNGNFFVNGTSGSSTYGIVVARSTDTGLNWSQIGIPNQTNNHKNHLAVDVNPGSPYANNAYVSYAAINSSPINFSRSTDSAKTFSVPVTINGTVGSPNTNGPNVVVGPQGELYVTWVGMGDPGLLGFNTSTDGGSSWGTAKSIRTVGNAGSVKGISFGRSLPSMAVDRSNGPRRGWIYIVYPELNPSTPDILLIRSTDKGNTWSNPLKVNRDSGNDQWLPWISVDPATGNLFVIYYDSRNFPANDSAEVYISASGDGGNTFADNLISDVPFKPTSLPVFPFYGGAYIGISALRDTVWSCWYDNRTGVYQVYASRILTSQLVISAVEIVSAKLPSGYVLDQNFPNPFNPSTEIQFSLPQRSQVTLTIFDLLGREVTTLVSEELSAGSYSTRWDAGGMPTGVYLYRLRAGDFVETKKLLLLR